jgi:hypothetical protein
MKRRAATTDPEEAFPYFWVGLLLIYSFSVTTSGW